MAENNGRQDDSEDLRVDAGQKLGFSPIGDIHEHLMERAAYNMVVIVLEDRDGELDMLYPSDEEQEVRDLLREAIRLLKRKPKDCDE